ncbi:hypothetical protein Anas_06666 [Armadillidium nasatum]|uniref:Ubiquitin-like domain-containing protein n=1 Tax=Armadillidium nasatum TaxID=96803 RepID=A0A5N5SJU2_9CRUS|nr:hypothetical protein Anas_06666 [Armadillidium nasatum]
MVQKRRNGIKIELNWFVNMVIVNVSLNSNFSSNCEIISLKDVNVNDNVKSLKNKINGIRQVDTEKINIIHSGSLLKDEEFLHDVGIENESMVYCLPQNDTSLPVVPPLSLIEVQQLLVSLRTATSSPNFRSYIEKLRTSEQISRLVTECPALKKDPFVFSIYSRPGFSQYATKC